MTTDLAALVGRYQAMRRQHEVREAVALGRRVLETCPEGPRDSRVVPLAARAKAFATRELGLPDIPMAWGPAGQSWVGIFRAPPARIHIAVDIDAGRVVETVLHEHSHVFLWLRGVRHGEEEARAMTAVLIDRWKQERTQ